MATITFSALANGNSFTRTGTAQADWGQTDWLPVPGWARYAYVSILPTAVAGTTPVLTPSFLGLTTTNLEEAMAFKIAEHTAFTGITTVGVNEVQTLSISAGDAADSFKLTNNSQDSDAVVFPAGGFADVTAAQIKTALVSINQWTDRSGDIAVVKSTNDYIITFSGRLGRTDIGDTTTTDVTGTSHTSSVAETTKGVAGAQLTASIGPGVTGIADDVTNSATAAAQVNLNAVLPPIFGLRIDLDRTTGNETYTYTATVNFRS